MNQFKILDLQLASQSARNALAEHLSSGTCILPWGECRVCAFWKGYLRCIEHMQLFSGSLWPKVKMDQPELEFNRKEPNLTTRRAINFEE